MTPEEMEVITNEELLGVYYYNRYAYEYYGEGQYREIMINVQKEILKRMNK